METLQPQDHVLVLRVRVARKIKKGAIVLLDASADTILSVVLYFVPEQTEEKLCMKEFISFHL